MKRVKGYGRTQKSCSHNVDRVAQVSRDCVCQMFEQRVSTILDSADHGPQVDPIHFNLREAVHS
jgi:hypothetical protein